MRFRIRSLMAVVAVLALPMSGASLAERAGYLGMYLACVAIGANVLLNVWLIAMAVRKCRRPRTCK